MPCRYKEDAAILLVEDDPGDAATIREAFGQALASIRVYVVSNGEQALDFVRRPGPGGRRPDLILLDLNRPLRSSLEVLTALKGDDEFSAIPIVVLTASHAARDEERCYSMHVNAYVIRPAGHDGFASAVNQIVTWFLGLITIPESS